MLWDSATIWGGVQRYICKLSRYSFGVYLVHALVIETLNKVFRFNTLIFNPVISVPVVCIVVSVISLAVSWVLHRIPVLNKYVV